MPDTVLLPIGGMSCTSCQTRIKRGLLKIDGVQRAEVSYEAGSATVAYDPDRVTPEGLVSTIEELGYHVLPKEDSRKETVNRTVGLVIVVGALYLLMEHFGILNLLVPSQLAETNMDFGMLFVIGLVTSIHCLAMCGGINLSQCIGAESGAQKEGRLAAVRAPFLYNLGRVVSYTAIGFVAGALGSAFTFSPFAQGILKLAAGVLMVVMGINLLGIFPSLRRFAPRMPRLFSRILDKGKTGGKGPLIVGLLNGLMPCGPLQAMQIYALSTGNPVTGALSMLLFSLGTVPLVFGLGTLGSALSMKFTRKAMTVGAVLVMVLGLSMFSQGWGLSGFTVPSFSRSDSTIVQDADGQAVIENGVQIVNSTLSSGRYPTITVQAGMPVQWTIDAPANSINGCNGRMIIPGFDIEHGFQAGENVIEFTPTEAGTYSYSCWMGMIRGSIRVTEA